MSGATYNFSTLLVLFRCKSVVMSLKAVVALWSDWTDMRLVLKLAQQVDWLIASANGWSLRKLSVIVFQSNSLRIMERFYTLQIFNLFGWKIILSMWTATEVSWVHNSIPVGQCSCITDLMHILMHWLCIGWDFSTWPRIIHTICKLRMAVQLLFDDRNCTITLIN